VKSSTLFVVRVWRAGAAFRASVRRVDDEEARMFHEAAALARYLESSAALAEHLETNAMPRPSGEKSN